MAQRKKSYDDSNQRNISRNHRRSDNRLQNGRKMENDGDHCTKTKSRKAGRDNTTGEPRVVEDNAEGHENRKGEKYHDEREHGILGSAEDRILHG